MQKSIAVASRSSCEYLLSTFAVVLDVKMAGLADSSLKNTPRMTTRSRNQKSQGVRNTPLTPKMGEDEKALLETI